MFTLLVISSEEETRRGMEKMEIGLLGVNI